MSARSYLSFRLLRSTCMKLKDFKNSVIYNKKWVVATTTIAGTANITVVQMVIIITMGTAVTQVRLYGLML